MTQALKLSRSLLVVACLVSGVVEADLEAGLDAVRRKDYAAAFAEFRPLAEKGDPDAQIDLGNLFMRGWGVHQDYAAAFDWYQKAADQQHPIAQSKLGMLHYYGLGTIKDSEAAAKWFRRAADQGVGAAQSVLGNLYAQGDGVPKDLMQAFFWLTLAFEFGDTEATRVREQLAAEMAPGEVNEALAKVEAWNRERGIPDPGGAPEAAPAKGETPAGAAKTPRLAKEKSKPRR